MEIALTSTSLSLTDSKLKGIQKGILTSRHDKMIQLGRSLVQINL